MQGAGVDRIALRELADGPGRERLDPNPGHGRGGRQLAQDEPQRMRAVELVVAVGRDHERLCVADPPAEDTQDVERRLVGPVHVLDDDDQRRAVVGPEERRRDVVGPASGPDRLGQSRRCRVRKLEEWPERPRRQQWVTAPAQR